MNPDQYCEDKTAADGSSFSYSFLFLEPEQRRAMTALYAFWREVDDIVDECRDIGVARVKLAWWCGEIDRVYTGTPQHPVGCALQAVMERYPLPKERFFETIAGMEMDLEYNAYRTFEELSLYCYRVASTVGLIAAEIFGYQDHHTPAYAQELGIAFQLTNILRDVGEDGRRGRVYIPEEDMIRFGVTREDILEARMTDSMRQLLAFQAERARHYYAQAHLHLPEVDRYRQRSGLIMSAIYQALLTAIEANDYEVFAQHVSLKPLRKIWIAWSIARAEKRRYLSATLDH